MKLVVFFGIIILTLFLSLLVGRYSLRTNQKVLIALLKALLLNIIVLGLSTIWWFATELDGISQGIGAMINIGAAVTISLLDLIFFTIWSRKIGK
ncbi:hypothetical protein [Fredinandcohnia sp. 179-A 10B2 NHS]|uniref:hypothetical protein n=1 Tax=Fredinandcohnia sp. 179-A 10B2 NHS TaxID=3235176 RepID=UPI00399F8007